MYGQRRSVSPARGLAPGRRGRTAAAGSGVNVPDELGGRVPTTVWTRVEFRGAGAADDVQAASSNPIAVIAPITRLRPGQRGCTPGSTPLTGSRSRWGELVNGDGSPPPARRVRAASRPGARGRPVPRDGRKHGGAGRRRNVGSWRAPARAGTSR